MLTDPLQLHETLHRNISTATTENNNDKAESSYETQKRDFLTNIKYYYDGFVREGESQLCPCCRLKRSTSYYTATETNQIHIFIHAVRDVELLAFDSRCLYAIPCRPCITSNNNDACMLLKAVEGLFSFTVDFFNVLEARKKTRINMFCVS